jgi:hypothetical protein
VTLRRIAQGLSGAVARNTIDDRKVKERPGSALLCTSRGWGMDHEP